MSPKENLKLWRNTTDRRKYENLADLYAIIKTTEHLEAAYVRDDISQDQYTEACTKLISQYKTAENALRLDGSLKDLDTFAREYFINCPRALERLRMGIPATLLLNTTNQKAESIAVAQTVQSFITLMDAVKLSIRAVDEIQPLLNEMITNLSQIGGLPSSLCGRFEIETWLKTLNAMRASEELIDDQARQLSFDLERAYSSFMQFLNK